MILESAIVFAATGITINAAHEFADHVLGQTDKIAANKVKPGREGWSHILQHVASYHVVMIVMLLVVISLLNLPVTILGFTSAMLFSAVSHAIIDRRWPVRLILEKTGSPKFAEMMQPLCGMYLADQSLHKECLWISALLIALL